MSGMVVLYRFATSQADSCLPKYRRIRDGAPDRSLGWSSSKVAADTHGFRLRTQNSTWKSTGNRTSMPRSPRVPWTSSPQMARAVTVQSLGSSMGQQTSMHRSAERQAPPSSRYSARTVTAVRSWVVSPSRLTDTAPQSAHRDRMDSAATPISSTSRTVCRRVTASYRLQRSSWQGA